MQNRRPSRPRSKGETVPVQGEKQQRSLRMPHERDESAQSQEAKEPSGKRLGAIAHDDIAAGRTDTDKGPVLDATYEKLRKGTSQPVKRFRR